MDQDAWNFRALESGLIDSELSLNDTVFSDEDFKNDD